MVNCEAHSDKIVGAHTQVPGTAYFTVFFTLLYLKDTAPPPCLPQVASLLHLGSYKSLSTIFQHHLLTSCLCYILVILAIFQAFSLLLRLLW